MGELSEADLDRFRDALGRADADPYGEAWNRNYVGVVGPLLAEVERLKVNQEACREFLVDLVDTAKEKGRIPLDFEPEARDLLAQLGSDREAEAS